MAKKEFFYDLSLEITKIDYGAWAGRALRKYFIVTECIQEL